MKNNKRILRVSELLKVEISDVIHKRVKDPRIGFVTITDVHLSSDLRQAKIYFSIMGSEEQRKQSFKGLVNAQSFIQKEIASRIRLRYVPCLTFYLDTRFDDYERIEHIINELNIGDGKSPDVMSM